MTSLAIFAFLQTPAPQANPLIQLVPFVLIAGVFYFLVFMPMQRQKKAQQQMLSSLQNGANVLTSGGLVGTIVSISDDKVVLRVKPDNIKIEVARNAITGVIPEEKKS
jgi:preprotein translocase subunit YajC